ncbi:MAG TPA: replication protein [Pyrinomonadaceae bacterium]|nr:replication protein [Pyrinomonadaceae bacterium]
MFDQLDALVRHFLEEFHFTTRELRILKFILRRSYQMGKEACLITKWEDMYDETKITKGNVSKFVAGLVRKGVLVRDEIVSDKWIVLRILADPRGWKVSPIRDWNTPGIAERQMALQAMNERGVQEELFARHPELNDARVAVGIEGLLQYAESLGLRKSSSTGRPAGGSVPESGTNRWNTPNEGARQANEASKTVVPDSGTIPSSDVRLVPTLGTNGTIQVPELGTNRPNTLNESVKQPETMVPTSGTYHSKSAEVPTSGTAVYARDVQLNVKNVISEERKTCTERSVSTFNVERKAHLTERLKDLLDESELHGIKWVRWEKVIETRPTLLDEKLSLLKARLIQPVPGHEIRNAAAFLWSEMKRAILAKRRDA